MTNQPEHSLIGASSMHRWANCPGSVNLSKGMPNISSKYAQEGTEAHELAAYYLEHDRFPNELDHQEKHEMIDAVMVYVNAVLEDKRAFNQTFRGNLFLVEQGFQLKAIDSNAYGTSDCVIYNVQTKTLIVYDFKYGAGISVDVEHNEQLMYYALGALLSLPKGVVVNKVILKIVQPRCPHPDGYIREWAFPSFELLDFYVDLENAIRETQNPKASLKSGEWCRFCPAAPKCPILTKNALDFAQNVFDEVEVKAYEPNQLSEMLDKAEIIDDFISKIREFAYQEAMHGRLPPGYKLVQKRGTRKWRDNTLAINNLKGYGLTDMDLYDDPKLKSPAQIEKLIKKDEKKFLEGLVILESSGFKLAKISESGEPILLDAKSLFKDEV